MVKPTVNRRRFLVAGAVAGTAGVSAAAGIHDGELGGPPQTFNGAVPWQEGTADAPARRIGNRVRLFHTARRPGSSKPPWRG